MQLPLQWGPHRREKCNSHLKYLPRRHSTLERASIEPGFRHCQASLGMHPWWHSHPLMRQSDSCCFASVSPHIGYLIQYRPQRIYPVSSINRAFAQVGYQIRKGQSCWKTSEPSRRAQTCSIQECQAFQRRDSEWVPSLLCCHAWVPCQ